MSLRGSIPDVLPHAASLRELDFAPPTMIVKHKTCIIVLQQLRTCEGHKSFLTDAASKLQPELPTMKDWGICALSWSFESQPQSSQGAWRDDETTLPSGYLLSHDSGHSMLMTGSSYCM